MKTALPSLSFQAEGTDALGLHQRQVLTVAPQWPLLGTSRGLQGSREAISYVSSVTEWYHSFILPSLQIPLCPAQAMAGSQRGGGWCVPGEAGGGRQCKAVSHFCSSGALLRSPPQENSVTLPSAL